MTASEWAMHPNLANVLAWIGTVCWVICFTWMWRISRKQNQLLRELHEQTGRIETLSQVEHDLIQEVHPQVGEIKEQLSEVANNVKNENGRK